MRTYPLLTLAVLMTAPAYAQPQPEPPRQIPSRTVAVVNQAQPEPPKLTRFSLDFPGGTPQQLVTAIEKAMGGPLNVIIPAEHADFKLPPLKMNNVVVPQLFEALELTSRKVEAYVTGSYNPLPGRTAQSYQQAITTYGFRTPNPNAAQFDNSIWYFYVEKPVLPPPALSVPPRVCRFYSLTSYLERGLTVDDITTAIQTGWKMLGDEETPKISFHRETKLLIAVGEERKLLTIDAALEALQKSAPPMPALKPPKTEN
jgi:hypothetical protein